MSEGGFLVARDVFDHPMFNERRVYSRMEAWFWLLREASWKARRVRVRGHLVTLQRGQLAHSLRFMGGAWGWEKTKVERFLDDLKSETMIATDGATGITVTTICNYNNYQLGGDQNATPRATEAATPARHQRDKLEERKKERTDDDDVGARPSANLVSDEAIELTEEIGKIAGLLTAEDWTPGWCGAPMRVQMMLTQGWKREVMLASAREQMAKKRDGPPHTINYFEKGFASAHAKLSQPLPKVEFSNQPETVHVGKSNSALDALAQVRRGLGGGPDRGVVVSLPKR